MDQTLIITILCLALFRIRDFHFLVDFLLLPVIECLLNDVEDHLRVERGPLDLLLVILLRHMGLYYCLLLNIVQCRKLKIRACDSGKIVS